MEQNSGSIKKIVLAYSGGLDTSVMLCWLKEKYKCPVMAMVADVGQGEDLLAIEKKAYDTGADEVVISDLKESFVSDFVFPAMQSHALYEGEYLLGTALARPIIAAEQIKRAKDWGCDALAHGATGKGNDQVRFELTFHALAPELKIIAPWRTWKFQGRSDLIEYAESKGISVTSSGEKPYSIDQNIMHTSYEGGVLEDPWESPPESIFLQTISPQESPDCATKVEIDFDEGVPVGLNNQKISPVEILQQLNQLAGANGVGRVDLVENRMVGMKSRGIYETPGLTVLYKAHRALESLTLDRQVQRLKNELSLQISELIYNGFWFAPEMQLLLKLVKNSQKHVTGKVKMDLYKGNCIVNGRSSPYSLYDSSYATFEADQVYQQSDAEGFIRLQGLRLKIASLLRDESSDS